MLFRSPLGYNTSDIVSVCPVNSNVVRSELEKLPFIEKMGLFEQSSLIGQPCSMTTFDKGNDERIVCYLADMDRDALDVYGIKPVGQSGPTAAGWYLNETGAERLGVKAGDAEFTAWGEKMPLSGIFKDFHSRNVLSEVVPYIIEIKESDSFTSPYFIVKTDGSPEALSKIRQIVKTADRDKEGEGDWKVCSYEDSVSASFASQKNVLRIVRMFALISIIISILGFIGLSVFFIRQRRKEIGIRKILGSSSLETWALMFRTFYAPIIFSMIPAVILSWLLMKRWLETFSYRISLSPWIFVATCAVSLLIAVVAVGFQILRAVRANPADSIKLE